MHAEGLRGLIVPRRVQLGPDDAILAEATGNPMFGMLLESVQHLRHEPYRKQYDKYQLRQAHSEHQAILAAIRAGDAEAAEAAVREHLEKFVSVQPGGERVDPDELQNQPPGASPG